MQWIGTFYESSKYCRLWARFLPRFLTLNSLFYLYLAGFRKRPVSTCGKNRRRIEQLAAFRFRIGNHHVTKTGFSMGRASARPLRRICSTLRPETSSRTRSSASFARLSGTPDAAIRRRPASMRASRWRSNSVSTGGQNRSSSLRSRLLIAFIPRLSPGSSPQIGPGLLRSDAHDPDDCGRGALPPRECHLHKASCGTPRSMSSARGPCISPRCADPSRRTAARTPVIFQPL